MASSPSEYSIRMGSDMIYRFARGRFALAKICLVSSRLVSFRPPLVRFEIALVFLRISYHRVNFSSFEKTARSERRYITVEDAFTNIYTVRLGRWNIHGNERACSINVGDCELSVIRSIHRLPACLPACQPVCLSAWLAG